MSGLCVQVAVTCKESTGRATSGCTISRTENAASRRDTPTAGGNVMRMTLPVHGTMQDGPTAEFPPPAHGEVQCAREKFWEPALQHSSLPRWVGGPTEIDFIQSLPSHVAGGSAVVAINFSHLAAKTCANLIACVKVFLQGRIGHELGPTNLTKALVSLLARREEFSLWRRLWLRNGI